ncbi:MAG: hypothetical protein IT374_12170 [Polyangiaceae bacterium]|nr:hypothetical protein [Polyangiaceae bacterium]
MGHRGQAGGAAAARGGQRVERLLAVLERYVARLSAAAVVKASMARLGYVDAELSPDQLERLVAETMIGLRLFCAPTRLPDLMLELADLCDLERERR